MNNEKKLLEFFMGTENADHLYILILLVILDYITGICVAIHQKRLSSKIGFKGISLKVMIFVVLSMCHVLDGYLLGDGSTIQAMTILFYCANEVVSILENSVAIGLPLPQKLKEVLLSFKAKNKGKDQLNYISTTDIELQILQRKIQYELFQVKLKLLCLHQKNCGLFNK